MDDPTPTHHHASRLGNALQTTRLEQQLCSLQWVDVFARRGPAQRAEVYNAAPGFFSKLGHLQKGEGVGWHATGKGLIKHGEATGERSLRWAGNCRYSQCSGEKRGQKGTGLEARDQSS